MKSMQEVTMRTKPDRFWWTVIALGWVFDLLFWKKAPGVNFALYVLLCLGTGYWLLRMEGLRPARSIWSLFPFVIFLAAITFIRQEPMTVFLSIVLTLSLMGVMAISFTGGRWTLYGVLDYLTGFFRLLGSMVARPINFNTEVKKEQAEAIERGERAQVRDASGFWSVVRGIVIALPVVAIFAVLLASADMVFSQRLEEFIELFRLEKLPEYIFRLVYILIGAYALAGIFLHAATQSRDEKLLGQTKPVMQPFLGFTESAIVLGSVVVLFTSFVVIQFQYFFGGLTNIHLDGYTYSEYARRGFGELVAVAFFSLLLILCANAISRRENGVQRRVFSSLSIATVVLVLVMLVSAFQRLVLYESAYGFSRLRAYTHIFMIWLAVLLVVVAILGLLQRERVFALAFLVAMTGFVISLGLMNVDGFIVRQNVNRALQGENFDASYLASLSDDAVPALAAAYLNQAVPPEVEEGLGAALTCFDENRNDADRTGNWQSFHIARRKANEILQSLESDLQGYEVSDVDWSYTIIAPSGQEYYCSVFWD
jgi:hypothetical protein